MELRVLRYFLTVAREENITRAAALLHVTQPTLSRQLMQLEDELGVKLFHRSRYRIVLTDDGCSCGNGLRRSSLLPKRPNGNSCGRRDSQRGDFHRLWGDRNMTFLSRRMVTFRQVHPMVQFSIYSANADDIKDRLEKGILDLGLLAEPVDIGRMNSFEYPAGEQWGVLVRKDSPPWRRGSRHPPTCWEYLCCCPGGRASATSWPVGSATVTSGWRLPRPIT